MTTTDDEFPPILELLTAQQIAAELKVHVRLVWRWMDVDNGGTLPSIQLGRRRQVRRSDLNQFLIDRVTRVS